MGNFNLIGFDRKKDRASAEYKHCVIHIGSRLIQSIEDPTVLMCTECGTPYLEKDTATDEQINSMFGPGSSQSKIMQGKKQKKYYDQQGNEITDETLILDAKQGKTIISYHEQKTDNEETVISRKRTR